MTDEKTIAPVTVLGVELAHEGDSYGQRTWAGRLGQCAVRATLGERRWHLTLHGRSGHVIASGWGEDFDAAHVELLSHACELRDSLTGVG